MTTKIYDMRDVWSDAGTQYASIQMNAFDVNSEVNSKLLDLKRNGVSQFTINKLGEIVTGTIDIPQVNSLEETITALSTAATAGLAKISLAAANVALLQANTSLPNNSIGLVYSDPVVINNDWYYFNNVSNTWANTGLLPTIANQLTPRKNISRTIYVTMDGDDANNGRSTYKSVRTINRALLIANTVINTAGEGPCVVIVHPGEYEVEPYTQVPARVTLYGYDARSTICQIAAGYANTNMFMLNSGCKVRGLTIKGLQHESTWDPTNFEAGPPKYGYAFSFANGAFISRSPYVSDCCTIHSFSVDEMSLPQDRVNGNPLIPRGLGNIYADGSQCDPDSPLRSIVVDSFTAVNPNGVAMAVVNDAVVQLVSIFTNWSRVGIWAHSGGQITIVNSNSSFGDFAFVSTGFRYTILVPDITDATYGSPSLFNTLTDQQKQNPMLRYAACANVGNYLINNIESIANELYDNRYPTLANWNVITANAVYANLTQRDTRTIIRELGEDLKSGQDAGLKLWVQKQFKTVTSGEFTANTVSVFNRATLLNQFIGSYDEIRKYTKLLTLTITGAEATANLAIEAAMNLAMNVISTPIPFTVVFRSTIEAASQQFSYAGSGVNYNALPFGQRSSGKATPPSDQIYTSEGGAVYATYNTEQGDTYLGKDLRVDFERSVIEGQAFSRGVQNIVLPLIIGIGGG